MNVTPSPPPPPPTSRYFTGTGRTLGAPTSTSAGASTSAASAAAAAAAADASAGEWQGVDEALPSTSLQLRLPDGSRMVARFNQGRHTVRDIRRFVRASRPDLSVRAGAGAGARAGVGLVQG